MLHLNSEFLLFFPFLCFLGLIYNVVLVSSVQQSESLIHICLYAVLSCSVMSKSLPLHGVQAPLSMGILQARILEWVAMPSSSRSFQPRDQTQVSCIAGGFFTS